MISKRSRGHCLAFVFILTAVLVIGTTNELGGKPGAKPEWTWAVDISTAGNLYGDPTGLYEDGEDVLVRVLKESKNAYRFMLWVRSGRQIGLQNVTLTNLAFWTSGGPGYLPDGDCWASPSFCDGNCPEVFESFLNQLHPHCGYAYAGLVITVSLDIESMGVHETRELENEYVGFDIIYDPDNILRNPDDQLHNMDAQNVPPPGTGPTARPSPLTIERVDADTWIISSEPDVPYMNYAEFYKTYAARGRGARWTYIFPMVADGPFQFQTTWARSPVESR